MDKREILVSVTLLCYNHGPYLRRCLDSILSQKVNFRYQIVIGDDCSTDNSQEILREYEQKYPDMFVVIYNEVNIGAAANARNVRLKRVGKYISEGESDDFWTDEYRLQKQVDFLEANPGVIAVGSNYYHADSRGECLRLAMLKWQVNRTYVLKDYLRYGYVIHGNTMMFRNIFPENDEKYINLRSVAPLMGDVITRVLLYSYGDIFVLPDVMHAHSSGEENKTSFGYKSKTKSIEHSYVYCKIVDALEEYFDGEYNLNELKANRAAALMINKYIRRYDVDKKEYNKFFDSLGPKIRMQAKIRFIQKCCRELLNRIGIKLNWTFKEK